MLTFLGCGKLGTAILHGILSSQASLAPYGHPSQNIDALSESDNQTRYSFAQFIACVQHHHSAERIRSSLSNWPDAPVSILVGENLRGINDADVVILGTEPSAFLDVLDSDDVRHGLQGKILISILGGIRTVDLQKVLLDPSHRGQSCTVVSASPNVASVQRQSITILEDTGTPLPSPVAELAAFIFSCVGQVKWVPTALMEACTALAASTPALFAVTVDSLAQAAVQEGVSRSNAVEIAAYAMMGAAALLLQGEEPASICRKVATPGGATMAGLQVLEDKGLRSTLSDALKTIVGKIKTLKASAA